VSDKRALAMLALYRQGSTLQEIGTRYELTRERVRQILNESFGTRRHDGGEHAKTLRRESHRRIAKDRLYVSRWGCTVDQKKLIPTKARRAWAEQKRNARYRGVDFSLTLADFWSIWQGSSKWEERGRGASNYCMSRLHDAGAYEVGNVRIITNSENCRLYQLATPSSHRKRSKELQGVYCVLPGFSKPYKAAYGSKSLGFFATEDEAYAARRAHMLSLELA
jgi:hypothetical protein